MGGKPLSQNTFVCHMDFFSTGPDDYVGGDRSLHIPANSPAGTVVCSAYIIQFDGEEESDENFRVELTDLLPINPSVVQGQSSTTVTIINQGIIIKPPTIN